MNVTAIVIEQLENDGYMRTFQMWAEPGRPLTVGYADEFEEPRTGPFHFPDEHDEKKFERGFANCKAMKLPESRFTAVDGDGRFRHSWQGIPTERNSLSYYALSLPEFAIPTEIQFKDPYSDRIYSKNVIRDDKRNRFVAYLECRSSYGTFDFLLDVGFRNDQENFRRAKFSDEHVARHGMRIPSYEHLLQSDQRLLVAQFFSENPGLSQASTVLPFPPPTLTLPDSTEVDNSGRPGKGKSNPSDKLPAKKDLSRYLDDAKLTEIQRESASLAWEYGLSKVAIARRLGKHRTTVDENLEAAKKKIEQALSAEKQARKRSMDQK